MDNDSLFDPRISSLEIMWLNTRGGRDQEDVVYDRENRKYILMFYPGSDSKQKAVYIPSDEELVSFFNPSVYKMVEQRVHK